MIGIIGGSGLYTMPGLESTREERIETPFGPPSDAYAIGQLEGREVAFLARHGRGHRILPGEINYRANLFGFKLLGAGEILSLSAVGSLQEEHRPLDFVLPHQFFDRTKSRPSTFFGDGLVAHVSLADPVCLRLVGELERACGTAGVAAHRGGTYLCMEGPAFSTRAESEVYRGWGMDVIGMTNLQEAKLAREAELCYATVAMVTDYDCWHPAHAAVTVAEVIANLGKNAANACAVVREAVKRLDGARSCKCAAALKHALVTAPEAIPEATLARLRPIVGKYFECVKTGI